MLRKVIFVFLFFLFSFTAVSADSFPSNALGQILPEGSDTEYRAVTEGDLLTVFKNDEIFLHRAVSVQSDLQQVVRTVTETDSADKESVRVYRNGLLESRRYQIGNVIMNEKFVYANGKLLFISVHEDVIEKNENEAEQETESDVTENTEENTVPLHVENESAIHSEESGITENETETAVEPVETEVESPDAEAETNPTETGVEDTDATEPEKKPSDYIIYFLRSSVDGRLLGTKRFSSVSLTGDTYLFENNELLFHMGGNLVVNESFKVNEDLSVDFVQDEINYHYSEKGVLLSESSGSSKKTYSYDEEGNLVSYTETEGNISKTGTYTDGKLSHETVTDGTRITEETYFYDEGNVKVLYSNFQPIARVRYESDNRRVKQIEYLK